MEIVYFTNNQRMFEEAERAFRFHLHEIKIRLPESDVQHIGSTAIKNSYTKGDLDIQVRVTSEQFPKAVEKLSEIYSINEGSIKTDYFRAFKDDSSTPPLGVQLTVINSDFDFFWKLRDVLLQNPTYQKEYDELKERYQGKDMDDYREAKNDFFQKLMETPEYRRLNIQSPSGDNK